MPVRLLLRQHLRTGDPQPLRVATFTLAKMAAGGLYDQIGGGFHRYSTDRQWLVPHFEKMLYDNALLVVAYTEAWQLTGRRDFARIVRETCDELLATFGAPEGGFFAATDADSALLPGDVSDEGHGQAEGRFFVWTPGEVRAVLGDTATAALFLRHYGFSEEGNFEGRTIPHVVAPDEDVTDSLREAREMLRQARLRRPPPFRDEKVLTSWNGLAISAFARAGRALGEPRFVAAARRAATFAWDVLREQASGRLRRSFREGRFGSEGFLDDYAFLAAGLLDLYEATGETSWLGRARELALATDTFFAADGGGWYMTGPQHEQLLARERPTYDGAEPSGSAVAWMNALRLAAFTDEPRWRETAERAASFYAPVLRDRPTGTTEALLALDFTLAKVREIAVLEPPTGHPFAAAAQRLVDRAFLPHAVLARFAAGPPPSSDPAPFFARGKTALRDAPTVFLCEEGHCELPRVVTTDEDLQELRAALEARPVAATSASSPRR